MSVVADASQLIPVPGDMWANSHRLPRQNMENAVPDGADFDPSLELETSDRRRHH
jgi:hypothetical protein